MVSSIGPPHDPATGLPTESAQALRVRASKAWDNVVGLIGYFDLNANRVLDVIIDIFAGHALSNYAFFVELLRLTPWALPVKETQYDRRTRGVLPQLVHGQYESMEFDDIIRAAEQGADASDDTQTPRTCVLGQILGFKFAQFQVNTPILLVNADLDFMFRRCKMESRRSALGNSILPLHCLYAKVS